MCLRDCARRGRTPGTSSTEQALGINGRDCTAGEFFPRNYVLIGDLVEEFASQVSTPVLVIFEIIVRSAQVKNLLKNSLLSRQVAEAPIR